MNTFFHAPLPPLRPFIDRFWGWESSPAEVIPLPTLLPGTGAELYFHYRTPFKVERQPLGALTLGQAHLFCIRRHPILLSPTSNLGFIAVRFRIGMLQRFTNIPANELTDSQLTPDELWGKAGAGVSRAVADASKPQERIALIQAFLLAQLRANSADLLMEQAMSLLYRQGTALSIDGLSQMLGLGRRQLERRSQRFAGHSPSEIRGLCRFQQTIRALMLDPLGDMSDRLLAAGYYDQAHFIHDFRRRVGLPPQQYLQTARTKTHFYNTPLR